MWALGNGQRASDRKGAEALHEPTLVVEDLVTWYFTERGPVHAVDGISLELHRDETLALVGESGCGKSATALSIIRLIPSPPGMIMSGRVLLEGRDLLGFSEPEMCDVRGGDISMIFQEPMTSLNPVYTVGFQVAEAILTHHEISEREANEKAVELLAKVGIPSPAQRSKDYPHQMSGGMRQRVMIAMALAANPKVLIADEPTTALDVTIQAQILDLIRELQGELDMGVLLITHDFGIVAEVADRVAVMYAGQIVEEASVADLLETPMHPYTQGLISSVPKMDGPTGATLYSIDGTAPNLLDPPPGCRFAPRCAEARLECCQRQPELLQLGDGRKVRCFRGGGMR